MDTNGNIKKILIRDLCSRLPYGMKCYIPEINIVRTLGTVQYDEENTLFDFWNETHTRYEHQLYLSEFKPYLFPLSSMTEEQKEEFNTQSLKLQLQVIDEEIMYEKATEFEVDFYNKHHLDWRGLIPMGLAIDATGLNIY